MKKSKGRKKTRLKWVIVVLLLFFLALLYGLTALHFFDIDRIRVTGQDRVDTEEIISLSKVKKGDVLWQIRAGQLEEQVEMHVLIDQAHLVRILPRTLTIEVKERRPLIYIYSHGRFVSLDKEGIALSIGRTRPDEKLPFYAAAELNSRVHLGQKVISQSVQDVLSFVGALEEEDLSHFYEIEREEKNWLIYTQEGWRVFLGSDQDMDKKLEHLQGLLYDSDLLDKVGKLVSLDLSRPDRPLVRYE